MLSVMVRSFLVRVSTLLCSLKTINCVILKTIYDGMLNNFMGRNSASSTELWFHKPVIILLLAVPLRHRIYLSTLLVSPVYFRTIGCPCCLSAVSEAVARARIIDTLASVTSSRSIGSEQECTFFLPHLNGYFRFKGLTLTLTTLGSYFQCSGQCKVLLQESFWATITLIVTITYSSSPSRAHKLTLWDKQIQHYCVLLWDKWSHIDKL